MRHVSLLSLTADPAPRPAPPQRHAAGQGLPRSFLQADLDFVLPGEHSMAELLLGDAEVGGWWVGEWVVGGWLRFE